MHRTRSAGFTLIELLVVVGIVGLLAAAFLPDVISPKNSANQVADEANLREHYKWLQRHASNQRAGHLPTEGGHRFLLTTWIDGTIERTPENLARFFTPGLREEDPHYHGLRERLLRDEPIWRSFAEVTSADTHYAARAREHLKGMQSGTEAWAANDNEGGASFPDGTVNILYGNSGVRTLTLRQAADRFGWSIEDEAFPTFGPDSPHPDLRKLAK